VFLVVLPSRAREQAVSHVYAWLLFQRGGPVLEQGERGGSGVFRGSDDQKTLAVRRNVVLIAVIQHGAEQRVRLARFERIALWRYVGGHQLVVRRDIEDLAAIAPPTGEKPS